MSALNRYVPHGFHVWYVTGDPYRTTVVPPGLENLGQALVWPHKEPNKKHNLATEIRIRVKNGPSYESINVRFGLLFNGSINATASRFEQEWS